jgi:hypothetical protein
MTATPLIDLPGWMVEQLSQASPDLLRQMVQTFAEALMSADVDAVGGRRLRAAQPGPRQHQHRLSASGVRYPRRQHRPGHPQASERDVFPGVAAGAAASGRVRRGQRGGHFLSARGVHAADGEAGRAAGHHPAQQVPGQRDG